MKIPLSVLKTSANVILIATLAAAILWILPVSDNFFFQSKYYAFVIGTLLLGLVYVFHSIRKGAVEIVLSPFAGTLTVFGGAILASTFFTNNYPVESLLGFGGVYLAMILFVLFSGSSLDASSAKKIIPTLAISGSVLTFMAVLQLFGYGAANIINQVTGLTLPTNISISLAISAFIALQVIGTAILAVVIDVINKKHISTFASITLPILIIGLGVHIWAILPGKPAQVALPSWEASWSVALDTIRTPRAALIGMGPDSYVNMYTRFKPVWVNGTDKWAFSFSQGSDAPLTLLATTGFIGLISWLVLMYIAYKAMRKATTTEGRTFGTVLFATFVLQFFVPINIVILIIQAVLMVGVILSERNKYGVLKFQALAMSIEKKIAEAIPAVSKQTSFPVYLTAGTLMIALVILGYLTGRAYAASMNSFAANKALANNNAVGVYEMQQEAVRLNPFLDTYRRQYAATNMLIAQSLADKADATDAEKQQVAQLLQQAVREAQSATLLDPLDVQNWAVLAQIYQNMIGAVEEADQFAVQAYVQAIQNDPTNPALRVSVGGIFYNNEQYQNAFTVFDQAIQIKPDYQNAYYNAANTLTKLQAYTQATQYYNQLLQLMDSSTEDYAKVNSEYEEVKKLAEEQIEATKSAQLNNSASGSVLEQNLQSDSVNQPVNNDVDLSGNENTPLGQEVIASPTPSPSASPTPEESAQ